MKKQLILLLVASLTFATSILSRCHASSTSQSVNNVDTTENILPEGASARIEPISNSDSIKLYLNTKIIFGHPMTEDLVFVTDKEGKNLLLKSGDKQISEAIFELPFITAPNTKIEHKLLSGDEVELIIIPRS
jgi:hypothetical protein